MNTYPNLYYLQYFLDAVELGSITASAKKNRVSHPAVSRAISALEAQLGLRLLDHQKKAFNVTDVGLRTAEQARNLLKTATQFHAGELDGEDEVRGTLSIGFSRSLSDGWLPPLLKELRAKFRFLKVQVHFGTTSELAEAVVKGRVDLALTVGTQNLATLQSKVLKKGRFVLFEAKASKQKREGFERKSFTLTDPRFETELLKKRYAETFGSELTLACEISSWTGIAQVVKNDIGVGLVPDFVIERSRAAQFHIFNPDWFECDYGIYVHFLKASRHKKQVAHALSFVTA